MVLVLIRRGRIHRAMSLMHGLGQFIQNIRGAEHRLMVAGSKGAPVYLKTTSAADRTFKHAPSPANQSDSRWRPSTAYAVEVRNVPTNMIDVAHPPISPIREFADE
jgi:hypothetical protein